MIRCRHRHLIELCTARGYDSAKAMACVVREDGEFLYVDEAHPSYPRPRLGLGDMVAAGLSSVGITKQRAQAVANAIGIRDCGCSKRQEAMNEWGRTIGIGGPPPADPENGPVVD